MGGAGVGVSGRSGKNQWTLSISSSATRRCTAVSLTTALHGEEGEGRGREKREREEGEKRGRGKREREEGGRRGRGKTGYILYIHSK